MSWFAAHCVSYVKFLDGEPQDRYQLEENIVLVQAEGFDEAKKLGIEIGKSCYAHGELTADGRPAKYEFIGVRKVIEVSAIATLPAPSPEWRPGSGAELSYSTYATRDEASMRAFARGESAELECLD